MEKGNLRKERKRNKGKKVRKRNSVYKHSDDKERKYSNKKSVCFAKGRFKFWLDQRVHVKIHP